MKKKVNQKSGIEHRRSFYAIRVKISGMSFSMMIIPITAPITIILVYLSPIVKNVDKIAISEF